MHLTTLPKLPFPLFTLLIVLPLLLAGCDDDDGLPTTPTNDSLELVAEVEGIQVTGITRSDQGRTFVTFPRWRQGVPYTLAELVDGQPRPYPSADLNAWDIGQAPGDKLVNVQSAIAVGDTLYVADTRNPLMEGLIAQPLIHLFDLNTNTLLRTYELSTEATVSTTYVNDLRVDRTRQLVYFTDSGEGGLMVLDLRSGDSWRHLTGHPSVQAEFDTLTIASQKIEFKVPSDGIAIDVPGDRLLYHALSGYTLYSVPLSALATPDLTTIGDSVTTIATTPAPDGMWRIDGGTIMADLEAEAVVLVTDAGVITTLVEGEDVGWADTFTADGNFLYFTNSKLAEAPVGEPVSGITFSIYRIPLPGR